jgi:hypothetical protein
LAFSPLADNPAPPVFILPCRHSEREQKSALYRRQNSRFPASLGMPNRLPHLDKRF